MPWYFANLKEPWRRYVEICPLKVYLRCSLQGNSLWAWCVRTTVSLVNTLSPCTWKVIGIYWQKDWDIANGLKSHLPAFKLQCGQPVKRLYNVSVCSKKGSAFWYKRFFSILCSYNFELKKKNGGLFSSLFIRWGQEQLPRGWWMQ